MQFRYKLALAALVGSITIGPALAQNQGGNFGNPGGNQAQNQSNFGGANQPWQNSRGWQSNRGWMMQHWAAMQGSSHFKLRQGQSKIDVRCPANQNLQNCVQATQNLVQLMQEMANTNAGPNGGNASEPQGQ
jgi:hypothetical protein